MRRRILAAVVAMCAASPAAAHRHPLRRSSAPSLLVPPTITPGGTLIREGERLRTLELDELAPLRLRISIPF
ncbi:hypothetical protein [Methylobacterium brachiatum]|uniref:hypothetical protein n=1 Tax=Methylobacterium brachiatum TaxID=269660 RepID=UPI0024499BE5|nr:hypothetical protein [Methylobacterium brachiatum]MDH2313169.1 hypothetical protein [Methylobacterium brachiatum]